MQAPPLSANPPAPTVHGHGGPGHDRRLDRPGAAAWSPSSRSRWAAARTSARLLRPGEAVVLLAARPAPRPRSTRTAPWRWSAAASATPCCSASAPPRARPAPSVVYFAGYKALQRPVPRWSAIEAGRRRDRLVLRRGPRLRASGRPQDRSFVGNIVQAMAGLRLRRASSRPVGAARGRGAHDRHRVGPHDGRRSACRPARRAGAVPAAPGHTAIGSINSPDAMHDEGGLRPVPAGRRPTRSRASARWCSVLLQPGPGRSTSSTGRR